MELGAYPVIWHGNRRLKSFNANSFSVLAKKKRERKLLSFNLSIFPST